MAAGDGSLTLLPGKTGGLSAPTWRYKPGCTPIRGLRKPADVVVSPDGRNVYVTASDSDAVAAFAPAVSMSLSASLSRRRLSIRLTCPASHETACLGRVSLAHQLAPPRRYALHAGSSRSLSLTLPTRIVRALTRGPLRLSVAASEQDRSPVVRRITLGARQHPQRLRSRGDIRTDTASAIWLELRQSFCAPRSSANWCHYLKRVRIARTSLIGVTTLTSPGQARGAARHICAALSTFAFATHHGRRLTGVRVKGRHSRTLAWRPNLSARCSP